MNHLNAAAYLSTVADPVYPLLQRTTKLISSPTGLCDMSMSSLLSRAPLRRAGTGDAKISEEYLQQEFGGIPQRFHEERRSGTQTFTSTLYLIKWPVCVCIYISVFGISRS